MSEANKTFYTQETLPEWSCVPGEKIYLSLVNGRTLSAVIVSETETALKLNVFEGEGQGSQIDLDKDEIFILMPL